MINRLRPIFIAVFILIFVVAAFAQKGEEIISRILELQAESEELSRQERLNRFQLIKGGVE